MSVPKIGEFMDASEARRKTILKNQKFWTGGQRMMYHDSDLLIRSALLSTDAVRRLRVGASGLKGKLVTKDTARIARDCSVEAINHFAALHSKLDLAGVDMLMSPIAGYHQAVEGVDVSVRPLVRLKRTTPEGTSYGALLVVMRKEEGLTDHAGRTVATVVAAGVPCWREDRPLALHRRGCFSRVGLDCAEARHEADEGSARSVLDNRTSLALHRVGEDGVAHPPSLG